MLEEKGRKHQDGHEKGATMEKHEEMGEDLPISTDFARQTLILLKRKRFPSPWQRRLPRPRPRKTPRPKAMYWRQGHSGNSGNFISPEVLLKSSFISWLVAPRKS